MWCTKSSSLLSQTEEMGSVPVYLNVYDLTPFNGYAYWLGLGAYHSGVQVDGVEYAFGAHEYSSTGIFEGEPKQCEGFAFRKTVFIGKTEMTSSQVRSVIEDLSEEYKGNSYNLITKNCNHFCNDACIRLTGNSIPCWVNRLARIGFMCNCVLPVTLNCTKVGHHNRIEDNINNENNNNNNNKTIQGATIKKLTSESNNDINFSVSSSPSPSATTRRGRSRTRRPRPPSSPLIVGPINK